MKQFAGTFPTPPVFSAELVDTALRSFNPSAAGGLFGYKPALLQQCVKASSSHFLQALTMAVNLLASGQAPSFLKPFVAGGNSIALSKPDSGIRPLCSGDPIRRLVAKCFCIGGKEDISGTFQGKNYGVGCPGGVEVVAHSLRDSINKLKDTPGMALLKIDFKNAFNLVDREEFIKSSCIEFPAMSSWTYWCYDQPSILLFNHERVMWSTNGTQQGDPLGPLYYCSALRSIVASIADLKPEYQKWYMDDGGIIGNPDLLKKVWEVLVAKGPALGMHVNPSKCEWSWLDRNCNLPCPIKTQGTAKDQVKLVPTDEICMLGVPMGMGPDTTFSAAYVKKKIMKTSQVMTTLAEFEDVQSAFFLLRTSYNITRATHFMRTTPLSLWQQQAVEFDLAVRDTAEKILGSPFSEREYRQAATSVKVGGLSIRQSEKHAAGAYAASRIEAGVVARETWLHSPSISGDYKSQSEASLEIDIKVIEELTASADPIQTRLLERLQEKHAGA